MRISDWSSDVCSSDLQRRPLAGVALAVAAPGHGSGLLDRDHQLQGNPRLRRPRARLQRDLRLAHGRRRAAGEPAPAGAERRRAEEVRVPSGGGRSEEHTSELQSLMRISYDVFCFKKKTRKHNTES